MSFVLPDLITEGQRNDMLTRRAGQLRRYGADEPAIVQALLRANSTHCIPPLSDLEVRSIARSVSRYPPGPTTWGRPPRNAHETTQRRGYRLIGSVVRLNHSRFTVGGRRGGGPFVVDLTIPDLPTCTCIWFRSPRNSIHQCAHTEASRLWVRARYRGLEVPQPP